MGMQKGSRQRGRRKRSPEYEYMGVNDWVREEEGAPLYRPRGICGRRSDSELGRGRDAVQRTWTVTGKVSKSLLGVFWGLFPSTTKGAPATHHVCIVLHRSSRLDTPRPRPRPGLARQASVCVARQALFNFTSGVCSPPQILVRCYSLLFSLALKQ
jgi:hypothetical protein